MAKVGQGVVFLLFTAVVIYLTASIVQASVVRGQVEEEHPGRQGDDLESLDKRAAFQAWAGKRSVNSDSSQTDEEDTPNVQHLLLAEEQLGEAENQSESTDVLADQGGGRKGGNDPVLTAPTVSTTGANVISNVPENDVAGNDNIKEEGEEERVAVIDESGEIHGSSLSAQPAGDSKEIFKRAAAFSAWAGKRAAFNSWAGKRSDDDLSNYVISDDVNWQKRQAFNSWGGKRGDDAKRKAFSVWAGKRSDFDTEEKKRHAFNSWGGKRDAALEVQYEGTDGKKRQAFDPWKGKRAEVPKAMDNPFVYLEEKRTPFSAWSGKRMQAMSDEEAVKRKAFNSWAGKRAHFSAWAGKKGNHDILNSDSRMEDTLSNNDKRAAFSAWAGKRSSPPASRRAFSAWAGKRSDTPPPQTYIRRAFNAWGGKRSVDAALSHYGHRLQTRSAEEAASSHQDRRQRRSAESEDPEAAKDAEHNLHKRAAFSAWAGKRAPSFNSWAGKRAAFNSWAGKRAAFSAWAGKRSAPANNWPWYYQTWSGKRAPFSAWGGKRSVTLNDLDPYGLDNVEKRAAFSAWAGKRSSYPEMTSEYDMASFSSDDDDMKRAAFNAWAGKRSEGGHSDEGTDNEEDNIDDNVTMDAAAEKNPQHPGEVIEDDETRVLETLLSSSSYQPPNPSAYVLRLDYPTTLNKDGFSLDENVPNDVPLSDLTDPSDPENALYASKQSYDPFPSSFSKRLWLHGHSYGFAPFVAPADRTPEEMEIALQRPTQLGTYLRRYFDTTPMKRKFNSWGGR